MNEMVNFSCVPKNRLRDLRNTAIKGIVQQILREVNTKLHYSVLVNWRPNRFSFGILKGHIISIKSFFFSGFSELN